MKRMEKPKKLVFLVVIMAGMNYWSANAATDSTSVSPVLTCQTSFITSFSHAAVTSGSGSWYLPSNLIAADIDHGGTLCPATYNVFISCDNFYTQGCGGSCGPNNVGSCSWQLKAQDNSAHLLVTTKSWPQYPTPTHSAPSCEYANPDAYTNNFTMWAIDTWNSVTGIGVDAVGNPTTTRAYQLTNIYFGLESGGANSGSCTVILTQ